MEIKNVKKGFLFLGLILFLCAPCIVSSCGENEDFLDFEREYVYEKSVSHAPKMGQRTWEKDLAFSYNGEGKQWLISQGLQMLSYELTNEVVKGRDILQQQISNQALFPLYNDSIDVNNFVIRSIAEMNVDNSMTYYTQWRSLMLDKYLDEELKVVAVKWKYGEQIFNTECLVVDSACVYDDILSNLRYIKETHKSISGIRDNYVRVKTRSESDRGSYISYKAEDYGFDMQTLLGGKLAAQARIYVFVEGREKENGIKSIDFATYNAPHMVYIPGYYAVGDVKATLQEMGDNGKFAYAYAIGVGRSPITISFRGLEFSITGEEKGNAGGKTITASYLR